MLGGDRFGFRARGYWAVIDAASHHPQGRSDSSAESNLDFALAQPRKIPDGVHTYGMQLGGGHRSHAPEFFHVQGMQHFFLFFGGDHKGAIGFGLARANLGKLLAGTGADGRGQTGLFADFSADLMRPGFDFLGAGTN